MDKCLESILCNNCRYVCIYYGYCKKKLVLKILFLSIIQCLNYFPLLFIANLIILSQGSTIGWNAPALITLTSKENTPLIDGALSNDQVSWIGSINCIGAIIGSLSFGYIVSLLGPKRSITLLMIPSLAFWLLIYFGNVYYHILLARFISGIAGGGMQTSLILYITEIANDE